MEFNLDQCSDLWVRTFFWREDQAAMVFFTEVGCGEDWLQGREGRVYVCVYVCMIGGAWGWEFAVWEDEEFSLQDMRFEAPAEQSVPISSWVYGSGFGNMTWVRDVYVRVVNIETTVEVIRVNDMGGECLEKGRRGMRIDLAGILISKR